MTIKPYKQTSCESCLPVCLLLLSEGETNQEKELSLLFAGLKGLRDSYAFGILEAFVSSYARPVTLFVDNKYFTNFLRKNNYSSLINIVNKPVNLDFETPSIVYLDSQVLGGYSHAPHFVIIEKMVGDVCYIIDPWEGKRKRVKKEKLTEAIKSLKYYLKYCPLVIKFNS